MQLGSHFVSSEELSEWLQPFLPGVQVNAIGSHCYSASLAKAVRALQVSGRYNVSTAIRSPSNKVQNLGFSQPWIASFAKMKLQHIEQKDGDAVSVHQHEEWLLDTLKMFCGDPGHRIPQSHLTPLQEKKLFLLE